VHNVNPIVPAVWPRFYDHMASGSIVGELVPMILLALLFSVAMSVAAESIAGEKERGTMATLLATPIKRRDIAFGKIGALTLVAMLSAISSFLGLMLALPNLLGGMPVMSYGFAEMALLFLVLLATVFLIIGMFSVVSAFAKNIKEATMMLSVFMVVGLGAGMLTMILGVPSAWFFYLIPFYNTAISLSAILTFTQGIALNLALTVISNVVYTLIMVWVLTKMFSSEKIMFSK